MTSSHFTIALLVLWAVVLATPAFGWSAAPGMPKSLAVAGVMWFLLNFFAWMVPGWRRRIVEARGPLLGFGFAFAGALISSALDTVDRGVTDSVLLFPWRTAILAIPFALPFIRKLGPYPHWIDFAVLCFCWALPIIPGFGGSWLALEGVSRPGLLAFGTGGQSAPAFTFGPGRLLGLALIATYFYGARAWTAAPLDWTRRAGDVSAALQMAASGVLGALLFHYLANAFSLQDPAPLLQLPFGPALWSATLIGIVLAANAEELTFRGIVQSGVPRVLPARFSRNAAVPALTVVAIALIHAAAGSFGLSPGAAFGLSLGIGLRYKVVNRLFPAVLAHGAAWAVLALTSMWM